MKKLSLLILFLFVAAVMLSGAGQYEAVRGLPASVKAQSRWGVELPTNWKEFDKSGDVRFLQLQTTAPASPDGRGSVLDGSHGERILEVDAAPHVAGIEVEWTLANKGPNPVWVVAGGMIVSELNIKINAGASSTVKTPVDALGYSYLVLDSEGSKRTELGIKAKIGDTSAKTSRGKSMVIVWF